MRLKNLLSAFVLVVFMSQAAFAGTASVYFGRGSACSGSGVCQLGATVSGGVAVNFSFKSDDGNGNNVLTMTFNYAAAQSSGFSITSTDGTYTFTAGYAFSDASLAKLVGVPTGYTIPEGMVGQYTAPTPSSNGNCMIVITQTNPGK